MGSLFPTRLLVTSIFVLSVLTAGRAACLRWWPLLLPHTAAMALPGLRVEGVQLAPTEDVRAHIEACARSMRQRRVHLVVRDAGADVTVLDAALGDLGVSIDVDDVVARALGLGRDGDMWTRAVLADRARRGDIDLPLSATLVSRAALDRLLLLKEDLDVPPVAARLDVEHHAIVPEVSGRALDVDRALAALLFAADEAASGQAPRDPPGADRDAAAEVVLPFVTVAPQVTKASLASIDVSRVLGSFVTYFSRRGEQGPRAQNIDVAAAHVNGLVIEPGQVVSFNDVVGARSEGNGFQKSFEIYKGEMVEGMGGGTCQVASTLHAVAFFGGLDIVERLPHSRPSAYIPVGLDATVVYPVVDLKLRNPYSFPVVVAAEVGPNKLSMRLLGGDKPARVALMRTVLATTPFERKVVEDPTVGKPRRKQKGMDGMRLLRKRLIALRGGENRVETTRDTYPPTTEIWKVPPGYDESQLPALGEDFPNPDGTPPAPTPPPRVSDPEQTIWGG